jgi:predicted protein tyrosine phosphatase
MNIQIFGQRELVEHIQNQGKISSHVISIGNPSRYGKPKKEDAAIPAIFHSVYEGIIRLAFFDVLEKSHLGDIKPKRIPQKRDVRKVIKFYRKNRKIIDGFDIHCWRGISRSTAIAFGLLYMMRNDEQVAFDELKKIETRG